MKIRSKFKDYYDYVGHLYGEDPDVVYNRGKVPNAGNIWTQEELKDVYGEKKSFFQNIVKEDTENRTEYSVEYIVAGELSFAVVRSSRRVESSNVKDFSAIETVVSYSPLDEEMFLWMVSHDSGGNKYGHYSRRLGRYIPNEEAYREFLTTMMNPGCQRKARQLLVRCGMPVIKVRPSVGAAMEVDENTPILKEHSVASLYPAEAMWQNIYSTMTNVLRPNPDRDPPVEISNRDKISKAGFDLKTSFRHPVNQKKVKR